LAQSSLRSGHALDAARYFQQYLRESPSLSAAQRGDVEKGLADAHTKLGRLEISAPAGTEIDVDGEQVGTAPLSDPVDVEPGSHTVKSSSDSKTLTVAAGHVEPVRLEVAPPPLATPAAPLPTEEPNAAPPTSTQATPAPVAPTPEASHPGFFSPPNSMAPFWIGLGVGVAGGATAIVFAIFKAQANSNAQSVANQIVNAAGDAGIEMTRGLCLNPPSQKFQEACQTLQSDNNLVDTNATVANVGLGVGIAGVAFSLGWYLFAPKRNATPAATDSSGAFVPIVGPRWNGLGYAGSF
jgi:hypothetical protein